jgi:hypothetical protein
VFSTKWHRKERRNISHQALRLCAVVSSKLWLVGISLERKKTKQQKTVFFFVFCFQMKRDDLPRQARDRRKDSLEERVQPFFFSHR